MDFGGLKMILVASDFTESSEAALRAALQVAQMCHAAIEIFHVEVDPTLILPPPMGAISMPNIFGKVLQQTAERLEVLVEEVRKAGVTCTSASEVGRSPAAIVERARLVGAGLIVIGNNSRHGLSHLLLGSCAEKVVEHAPCAVLVVPASTQP